MKAKARAKSREEIRRPQTIVELQVIPAPTVIWHPSISLEKLISDFAEYQDSIIVT
jgi:hypothetical protein